jgi:N-acetylmuramoyl-L-alanine amidase
MALRPSCLLPLAVACALISSSTPVEAKKNGTKRHSATEVIIHATGGPLCDNGRIVFSPPGTIESNRENFEKDPVLGIHYIIGRNGEVAASVPEDEVANHAIGHNEDSIGIELINSGDGREPFPDEQIAALIQLLRSISERHDIRRVLGHSDVDHSLLSCGDLEVRRKQDPGVAFPWDHVRRNICIPLHGTRHRVVGVRAEDVLNIRSDPNPSSPIVSTIPSHGRGIVVTRCRQTTWGRWCLIKFRCFEGWVNATYLSAD